MESELGATGWTKELETGIDILDKQHRRYFDLLDEYLVRAGEASTISGKVLDLAEKFNFLRQYAREHFSTEEEIMKESRYPDFAPHHEEHSYFLEHVEELYNCLKTEGYSQKLAREVKYYTAEWFIEHIHLTDMKLVKFLEQKSTEDKSLPQYLKKVYKSLFGND
jgi:hemerythrin